MSFIRYLKDSYRLIVFYCILMVFILGMVWLDRSNRLLNSNIVYLFCVSFFMFVIYLLIDYHSKYKYLKELKELIMSKDKTPIFPNSYEYKDELYSKVLSDLYNFYQKSLRDINDKYRENNEFVISWVHEIKTPITTSKLLTDSSQLPDEDLLSSIKEEINKIDDYVEEVLFYSRSDNFSQDYIISQVNLNGAVKESVKKHSKIFIRKHIRFVNEMKDDFSVDTDRKWLIFIVDQLVSNALKYTKEAGTVRFFTVEDDKEKVLGISDNGSGIKKEDIERLFTKCFTGSNGRKSNSRSTGFGLYLSQKLAKKLGHSITMESEYGKGTTVYIHFSKWNDYYINE